MNVYYKAAELLAEAARPADEEPRRLRVVGLLTNLAPYHHARWEAFAALRIADCLLLELAGKDEFSVLQYDPGGKAAYSRQVLFDQARGDEVSAADTRSRVRQRLSELKPDVVCLNGYGFRLSLAALEWSIDNRAPTVICSESNEFDAVRKPVKEWIKGRLVRLCAAGLAGGTPQAQYLNRLGLPRDRIFTGYDAVDNQYFHSRAEIARARAEEVRMQYDLPEHYFLGVSRFTEKKNLSSLIQAYGRYLELARRNRLAEVWELVILGDGPLAENLGAMRCALGLNHLIHFLGARPYDEIPAFYGLAEVFIHASTTEQWGLVVNEAMACGLPVLVSNRCGCAVDLVEDGCNGFSFNPRDVERLAGLMLDVSRIPPAQRRGLGEESRRRIARWGPEAFADGMRQAVDVAMRRPAASASFLDRLLLRVGQVF